MGKQLVSFITAAASRMNPLCNLQRQARTHAVLVIGFYELLGDGRREQHLYVNPTKLTNNTHRTSVTDEENNTCGAP